MSPTYNDLPPRLQLYVRDGGPIPTSYGTGFSNDAVLAAKQLRKQYFRSMQQIEPGSQYEFQDFDPLMRGEITAYVRRVLMKPVLTSWDTFSTLDRLGIYELWLNYLDTHRGKFEGRTGRKRERIFTELRRSFILWLSHDGRRLGLMETFVTNGVRYGIPTVFNDPD